MSLLTLSAQQGQVGVVHRRASRFFSSLPCSSGSITSVLTKKRSQYVGLGTNHVLCSNRKLVKPMAFFNKRKNTVNNSASKFNDEKVIGFLEEKAAVFNLKSQSLLSWTKFSVILATVLGSLYYFWLRPGGGFADDYVAAVEALCDGVPELTIVALLGLFGVLHSGLAALRDDAERRIGARAFRVVFAAGSLLLASPALVYFMQHRNEGAVLWDLRHLPWVWPLTMALNAVSFFFLYPSTFNLLEVAAVDKPRVHVYGTGVVRITRHPQAFGQLLWCLGHLLWSGTGVTLAASAALLAHHAFGCWHGDHRMAKRFGKEYEEFKKRTSIVPFKAILEGRQQLPRDYWKEFATLPYATIATIVTVAYLAHPLLGE